MLNTIVYYKKKKKMDCKYIPKMLFFKRYDCSVQSKNKEESAEKEESTNKNNQPIKKNL